MTDLSSAAMFAIVCAGILFLVLMGVSRFNSEMTQCRNHATQLGLNPDACYVLEDKGALEKLW